LFEWFPRVKTGLKPWAESCSPSGAKTIKPKNPERWAAKRLGRRLFHP
jgi:hypothetical protein